MRIVTLFGTRPEIIRLSQVIRCLDRFCEQILVHTGQNYDPNLSDIFFEELAVRRADIHLGVQSAHFPEQVGEILARAARAFEEARPERLLILGDTNSALSAIVAARMRIPVYHMEAGNRCYDDRVPEEINRRLVDHCSAVLMPYTHRSKENLLREGIERRRIFVIGNPIYEVLKASEGDIEKSDVLERQELRAREYFLATMHRAENVDEADRLRSLLEGLDRIGCTYRQPVVVSVHPRTADKMRRFGLAPASEFVRLLTPLGFHEFVKLERCARCVISDSGTVQEECAIFAVPNVTIRDVTERPETIECGSNVLAGADPRAVADAVAMVLDLPAQWRAPDEYLVENVSGVVVRIVLGYAG